MYKISRVEVPLYFNIFLKIQVHAHNTGQVEKLYVISHDTNVRASRMRVYGVKLWN